MTPATACRIRSALRALAAVVVPAAAVLTCAAALAQDFAPQARAERIREVRREADNDPGAARAHALQLLETLPRDASGSDLAQALNTLARSEIYLARLEEANAHTQAALRAATEAGDRTSEAESELNAVLIAINQGRMEALAASTDRAVELLNGANRPDLVGEALLRKAMLNWRISRVDDAVAMAMQASEIARQNGDPLALTYAFQGLAVTSMLSQHRDDARGYFEKMLAQAKVARSDVLQAEATLGSADAIANLGDPRAAETLVRDALATYLRLGMPFSINHASFALANMLRLQGHRDAAVAILTDVIQRYGRYPNPIGLWHALNARSADYQKLGRLGAAEADANRGYELARSIGFPLYRGDSSRRLASIAAARNDWRRAYSLDAEAAELSERAAGEHVADYLVELTQRYEQEAKQRKIDELTRSGERQRAQLLERELQQRWLATLLAGVAVALAATAFIVVHQRRTQRRLEGLNEQLRRSENDVRALNADLELHVSAATQEVRQQARYLRTLIDMLPMWAWFKDTQGRYVVVNQGRAAATGWTIDAMRGRTDLELLPPSLAQQLAADDEAVVESRDRKSAELHIEIGGARSWMEFYKAAVVDDDGTVLGTVGVARNIDERKALEAAREAALVEARDLARQRSEFLARMSHELRTPLNAIIGYAQLLQRDAGWNERQARGLRIIGESGQHLLTLINDLLDLARIDAAKLELAPSQVDLAVFLAGVCDLVRLRAEIKGLQFAFEPAPPLPASVRMDEKRVRQVLLNLLSNAVKFTAKGRVALRISSRPDAASRPPANAVAWLRFEVEDTGVGMDPANVARIFEPFEQLGDEAQREGGTGLGLTISRQLIRLMGGEIQVRSRLREGSVFSFEIRVPAAAAHTLPVRDTGGVPSGYEGERRRVLVVDDVAQNRMMLLDALETLGFQVCEAANGAEALEVARRLPPDLVLVDLSMPVMDGFETTRRIRDEPALARIPVVATSAGFGPDVEQKSVAAGADVFLSKPIEQSHLWKTIGPLMGLRWTYESAPAQELAAAASKR